VSLLRSLTDALAAEPGVPVVLASADPRVFCAGADLTITDAERAAVSDLVYDCCETIITRPGPVIAVLTGPAVGRRRAAGRRVRPADRGTGGAAALDRSARTRPRVGAWLLPDLVGRAAAMDLVLTGRWLEAAEALALGLVNRVCDDPEPAAARIAADLAGRGTGAAGAGVKAVMAAGGLLDRMRAERAVNRSAWTRVLAGP
jgi:Enoyl-CoA hydratase/carnithine racemase